MNLKFSILNFQFSILFSFCLVLLTGCEAEPPGHIKDPGHLVYLGFGSNREVQCSRCHGEEGTGGMLGPKLRGIAQRKGESYVRETIRNGKGEGDNKMPAFAQDLTEEQIEQVIRFLSTWQDTLAE